MAFLHFPSHPFDVDVILAINDIRLEEKYTLLTGLFYIIGFSLIQHKGSDSSILFIQFCFILQPEDMSNSNPNLCYLGFFLIFVLDYSSLMFTKEGN